mmetsp:Transcript_9585/g.13216  ORF Transcript_9585/g.13216 Transcript_9585/m.13216 type:complete len:102 (-) Transcript_9585:129-434(-)
MEVLGQVDAVHDGREIKRASVYDIQPNDLSLDEPGLNSTAAFSIVSYISVLAKVTDVALIMTINHPSARVSHQVLFASPLKFCCNFQVFNMLDDLLRLFDA